jgi:hypothetical protein
MFAKEIPDFIEEVMTQIHVGIERVHQKHRAEVEYPEHVELLLNVDAKIDDGTAEGAFESQSLWVKIPWPRRVT